MVYVSVCARVFVNWRLEMSWSWPTQLLTVAHEGPPKTNLSPPHPRRFKMYRSALSSYQTKCPAFLQHHVPFLCSSVQHGQQSQHSRPSISLSGCGAAPSKPSPREAEAGRSLCYTVPHQADKLCLTQVSQCPKHTVATFFPTFFMEFWRINDQ